VLDAAIRELDAARATVKGLRGEARQAFADRLVALDRRMIQAARETLDAAAVQEVAVEADRELAPFRERMPRDAYDQSRQACVERLIRERLRLPVIAFE
jgi:hypothetical protein